MKILWEGFFIEQEDAEEIFFSMRDNPPFSHIPEHYHVTTEFKPEDTHEKFYGEKIVICCKKYKKDETIPMGDTITANEGISVELLIENPELENLILELDRNWHITGSFKDYASKTNDIDFSDGEDCNWVCIGTFGGFDVVSKTPILTKK